MWGFFAAYAGQGLPVRCKIARSVFRGRGSIGFWMREVLAGFVIVDAGMGIWMVRVYDNCLCVGSMED